MKRISSIILCAGLAALALSSCTREQLVPRPEGKVTITATREGDGTKTNISTSGTLLTWAEDDMIGVANGENINGFTLATGENTGTATFTGDATFVAGDIYAWYPYSSSDKFGGSIAVDLGNQALSSGESTGKYFYMVAKGTVEGEAANVSLAFKNPLAAFVFGIDNNLSEDIVLKGLEVSADDNIFYRTGAVDLSGTLDNPAVTPDGVPAKSVAVSLSGYTVAATDGYVELPVVVLPYDFSGRKLYFTLTYDKGAETGKVMTKMISGQNLSRNSFAGINFVLNDASIEGGVEVSATKPSDIENLIQGTPAETVINVSASSAPVTADEAEIDLSGTNLSNVGSLNISLPAIPAEHSDIQYKITVPDGESAPDKVSISVADGEHNDLIINAPATTVSLDGASYGDVTAATADNTLILEDGVTVGNLTVTKGNVRLRGNAAVGSFSNGTEGTVNVIVEDSTRGELQLPEDFKQWGLEWDLRNAFINGENYTLSSDLDITDASITVPAGKSVVLDLNGHEITAANTQDGNIAVYGEMTLRDATGTGVISSSTDYSGGATGYGIITANGENAKVTMESGNIRTVRSDAANKGQFGVGVDKGGDFTMTGGKIEAGWYAVSGNGNNKTQNSVIEISGGELISTADYAVYLPQSGKTVISGGTINGAAGGISIQRGELVISGDASILSDGTGYTGDWSDGTGNQPNASLYVEAEYGACYITIEGGSFSAKGDAIALDNSANPENVNITVTGGTFSDLSALSYLGENADVDVVLDKDISLDQTLSLDKAGCNVTIDLNKNTLDYTSADNDVISVSQGKLTLKNGDIVADDYDGKVDGKDAVEGGIAALGTGSISAEDIVFTSSSTGFFAGGSGELSLTGTTVNAAVYCVTSNARTSDQKITVSLISSTFTGGTPILLNVPSDITIDGCTVTGEMPGMIIRGGSAEISNSTITLDFKSSMTPEYVADYFTGQNWGSGNRVNVAGLTIGNKAPNAYQYPTYVKLSNTDIIVTEASEGWLPAVYAHANEGEGLGVTFEYDGECNFTGDFSNTEGAIVYGSENITVNRVAVVAQPDGTFAPAATD